jgi:hypothetical protein
VSRALGKALNTLGKGFAECHTRQRAHGKKAVGKAAFSEWPNRKILKKIGKNF